jgi:uncharacterized damage-inducible protein DinB
MQEKVDIGSFALEALRIRVTRVLPAQIRSCVEELSEEQLWWRPNGESNSVGNLVLHVCGAMMHFLCRGVGGQEYARDRAAEFAPGGSMPKQELLAVFDEMAEKATETFAALDASRLGEPSSEPAYYSTVFEDLFGVAVHLATHTGQIVYVTKMLKEGSLDELWAQTHRQSGAWKR